jgi:hypothetical protein
MLEPRKLKMRTVPYYFGAILLFAASCSMAQIVECVDANGKKIYAQTCPDNANQKREIAVPPPPPKPDDSKWKAKEADFEKRRQERLKAQSRDTAKEQHQGNSEQECADARRRLAALQSGKPKNRVDPATGDHIAEDENQRQAEMDELQKTIDSSCNKE